jgi:hypothetical protein
MNAAREIIGQFRSLQELPPEISASLNRVATGFRYEAPNGDVYARYFDFMVVTPELEVVAAYRRGAPRANGDVPLEVFPPQARYDPRVPYANFKLHGPAFPAVITRLPVSFRAFQRYRARQEAWRRTRVPLWLDGDSAHGKYVVWDGSIDATRHLAGTRHVLVPDPRGPVSYDSTEGKGSSGREWLRPREDLLVVQGTEMSFGQRRAPGIAPMDEGIEQLYGRGGGMVPDNEAWARLAPVSKVALQDRPLKVQLGQRALAQLEEKRQRHLRDLQRRLERETDPAVRINLDRELYQAREELWWRDEQDFLYLISLSPDEEDLRYHRSRFDLARLGVEYGLVRLRLFLLPTSVATKPAPRHNGESGPVR